MSATPQRQVYVTVAAFCILGACIVVAVALALNSSSRSNNASDKANAGTAACDYQTQSYPASKQFRLAMRDSLKEDIRRLKEEARLYAHNAKKAHEPDVRRGALALAASKHRSWQRDQALLRRVKLLSPPRCKTT